MMSYTWHLSALFSRGRGFLPKALRGLILSAVFMVSSNNNLFSQEWVFNPFKVQIDPMEKLLLVNFEKDPDSLYVGFEPQVFDDGKNGRGHLIIGWRVDGKVDVYHQSSLTLDQAKYDIVGKGLANMVEVEMPLASFEINDFGVQADYQFIDLLGRTIKIQIFEQNPKSRKPFGLLAPMGDAAENPSAMPLVLLHDFYFVRRKSTDFLVSIDGKVHSPDVLPLPMDWMNMYFARYSPKPLIATLNPAYDGPLLQELVDEGVEQVTQENTSLELEWEGGFPKLKSLTRHNLVHDIKFSFDPAFPHLEAVKAGTSQEGHFLVEGHPSTGSIAGDYMICANKESILMVLVPSKGWKPRPTKISLRLLYAVGKVFKQWPGTYRWEARLEKTKEGEWHMKSHWKRTGKVL